MAPKANERSEFRSYQYINKVLKDLGWNPRHPDDGGDVYAQGEGYKHDRLLAEAYGTKAPDHTVIVRSGSGVAYWIIEAKANHGHLKAALEQAKTQYADKINEIKPGAARFVSGVAGTPESTFLVSTHYWNGETWQEVQINEFATTGLLSLEQCRHLIEENSHQTDHFDTDPKKFLAKAQAINQSLYNNGIPVGNRAHIVAALLLALAHQGNQMHIPSDPSVLLSNINVYIEKMLDEHGKKDFFDTIKLTQPATDRNHKNYWKALVETLQHLREMNIRSAINYGDDALGTFYETFLKYTKIKGDEKMGIVLTPRHITKFAVEVLGVGPEDRVFDPACGTGGFLVAALDAVRKATAHSQKSYYDKFKTDNIFGVEQEDGVYALALVNMIFRGDGKSNLYDGSCFSYRFWLKGGKLSYTDPLKDEDPAGGQQPFSRVLMNPPFKKAGEPEEKFVDHALRQTTYGGMLFAVLPAITISGNQCSIWRQELLKRHTLMAVIKFNKNLFYPVQEGTYGLILKAHVPHDKAGNVFMGVLHDDKHRPKLSKMVSEYAMTDNLENMTESLKDFLSDPSIGCSSIPRKQKAVVINPRQKGLAFAPEKYLEAGKPDDWPNVEDSLAGLRYAQSLMAGQQSASASKPTDGFKKFSIMAFVKESVKAPLSTLKEYQDGNVPVISATFRENGIKEMKDIPENLRLSHCISVSKIHNTRPCEAFWHPYEFSAINTVLLFRPIDELLENEKALLFLCNSITRDNQWKYDYANPVVFEELEVWLPATGDGKPDIAAMQESLQ